MPLSRSQYDAGDADPGLAALDFLRENWEWGFSFNELAAALVDTGVAVPRNRLRVGLAKLKRDRQIETKTVAGTVYYRYRRPTIGFGR